MFNDEFRLSRRPRLVFWSDEEIKKIHHASIEILERTGMEFYCPEVVEMLGDSGAKVINDKLVKIPSRMVEDALRTVNRRVILSNRKGERVMPLEEWYFYFGPGSETPCTLDPTTGERRSCVEADVVKAATVVDALPNIDFCMSFALASDVTKGCEDTHHFAQMALNTSKPLIFTSWDMDGIKAIFDIACAAAGSKENFQANPFILHYVEPVTPLRHPKESLDKLIFSIKNDIPVMYVPVCSAGGTAPVTFPAAFSVTNAEFLAGLVVSQLVRKGSSLIYGGGPNPLDPKSSVLPYASPETFMTRSIRAEIARFYGLPCFSAGGTTDSKVLDAQAGYEAGLSLILPALAGATFIHDVGYMEMGYTSSLELLTMCDEFISMIKRIMRGFEVSKAALAAEIIHEVGPGGNFLQHRHTFDNFRKEIWLWNLIDRNLFDNWKKKGSKDIRQRAKEKVLDLLEKHKPPVLSQSIQDEINGIVKDTDEMRRRKMVK